MDRLFSLFDTVWHAFTALDPIYQAVMAGLVLYIPLRRYFWPGWRLLRYALYRGQPLAWLRAMLELLYCLFYVQKTGSLFQAAQLRVELEWFNPRPAPLLRNLLLERAAEQPELAANVWLDTPNDWKHSAYSACHLPKLIADYYEHIKHRP